jgi:hypothetical protein
MIPFPATICPSNVLTAWRPYIFNRKKEPVSAFDALIKGSKSKVFKPARSKDKFSFYKDSTPNWSLSSTEIYKVQACVSINADFIAEKTMSFSMDPKHQRLI